jgi:hypothetical protein
VAKPNYQYEKRQRELAKKRKKEDKEQRKGTGPSGPGDAPNEPVRSEAGPPQSVA